MKKPSKDPLRFFREFSKQSLLFLNENETRVLTILFGIILVHRLTILLNSRLSFYSDDAIYAEMARFWIQGRFNLVFHPTWPPLYPFLSAIIFLLVKNWEIALRLVSTVSGALLIFSLYFLIKKFASRPSAVIFVSIFPFLIPIIRASLFSQSDMLATLLIISALTSFIYKRFYLASFLFGLTYLTRTEGLVFFALSLPFLISRATFKKLPIYLLIFTFTISPYSIATKTQTGSWSLSQKASAQIKQGHAFLINKNGTTWSQEVVSVKSPNYESEYFNGGLPYVLEYSDWYWFWFKQKLGTWKNVFLQNFPPWSVPVMALGISTIYLPVILIAAITMTVFATPIADPRYLLWAGVILSAFFFIGVKRLKFPVAVAFVAVLLFPSFNYKSVIDPLSYAHDFTNNFYREEIKMAGEWIKNNTPPDTKIMMKHEGVEFYGNGQTIYIPQDVSLNQVIIYGKRFGARYIIAWQEELYADKNLSILLSPSFKHKSLAKVFQSGGENPKIIIYEILP